MIGHALIELGYLTKIECSYEDCILPSREFAPKTGGRKQRDGITIDHIVEIIDGGDHMPNNLALLHMACNSHKGAKAMWKNGRGPAKGWNFDHSESAKRRWEKPGARERASASQRKAWEARRARQGGGPPS